MRLGQALTTTLLLSLLIAHAAAAQQPTPPPAPGGLVWSDEFTNTTASPAPPDPRIWTYDTGSDGFGNHELETYCAWGDAKPPCDAANPNAYVGTDGYLHIVARQTAANRIAAGQIEDKAHGKPAYTSARLKTQTLFSLRYGRVEARIRLPLQQGLWPAFWLLGNDIATVGWPACGEQDIMEHVDAPQPGKPDWIEGSVHGIGFTGDTGLGKKYFFPAGGSAGTWHTYGMVWSPGSVAYYVDDPGHPYATFTPKDIAAMPGAVWPFDAGRANFLLLNLAVGGDWPGPPDNSTSFPAEMLVDYVRLYSTQASSIYGRR